MIRERLQQYQRFSWLLFLLPFWLGLQTWPIYIVDEARNSQAAWEMYERSDPIVPTFNANLRTDKPPLHYYGMWLGYWLLGKSALAARLGRFCCAMLCLWLLYNFAKRWQNQTLANWAIAVFSVALYVPLQFHLATPDPYLALCFVATMTWSYQGFTEQRRSFLLLAYGCLAIGTLAKGPIIIVLAGLSWGLYLLVSPWPFWRSLWRLQPWWGIVGLLVLTLPWYWAVHEATNGAFTEGFFLEHNVDRFLKAKEGHGGSPLLIVLLLIAGLLPFGGWVGVVIAKFRHMPQWLLFSWSIVVAVSVFFALSGTKLPSYPFPAFPFLALLVAWRLQQLSNGHSPHWGDHLSIALGLLFLLSLPAGWYLGLQQDRVLFPLAKSWWQLLPFSAIAIVIAFFWWSKRKGALYLLIGSAWCWQMFLLGIAIPRLVPYDQVQAAQSLIQAAPARVAFGRFSPAFVFYAPSTIPHYSEVDQLRDWLARAPDSSLVLTAVRFRDKLPTDVDLRPVFEQKDLFEYPTTLILQYHVQE